MQPDRSSTRHLVRSGALAGAIAAASTTALAAIARAAGVPLEVDAEAIPILAFAWWTLCAAALGVVLARLLHRRRRFVLATTAATGLSLVPAVAAPDHLATRAVLVAAHLCAAVIIIPTLGARLTAVDHDRAPRRGRTDLGGQPARPVPSGRAPDGGAPGQRARSQPAR